MNEAILAEASEISPGAALAREERAHAILREAVAGLDDESLGTGLGNGDTLEEVIRYDGPDHYAEHTAHLRAWFGDEQDD
jgi:hypothetical protein